MAAHWAFDFLHSQSSPPITSQDFTYWLQGYAELHGGPPTAAQWEMIKEHLGLVFNKVTTKDLSGGPGTLVVRAVAGSNINEGQLLYSNVQPMYCADTNVAKDPRIAPGFDVPDSGYPTQFYTSVISC